MTAVPRPYLPDPIGSTLEVLEGGRVSAFSFEEMLSYSGPGSPGGVAVAFKVLERGLPLLEPDGPPRRREITVRTAFGGPGARDGFELVTRAVTDGRYFVEPELARPESGRALERFVFWLEYPGRTVTLDLREGYVSEEFVDLAGKQGRSGGEESRLTTLKLELAELVMAAPAEEVFDAGP